MGTDPGLAEGWAWCLEFLEVCAGVRGAHVLVKGHLEGAFRRMNRSYEEGMCESWDEVEGGSMAPNCELINQWQAPLTARNAVEADIAAAALRAVQLDAAA